MSQDMPHENANQPSLTDWARVDNVTDEDIDTSDIPPLDDAFFANATLRMLEAVPVHVDADVVAWFRQQGGSYREQMNAILRSYMTLQEQFSTG